MGDETIHLVRVENRRGHAHLTVARSNDGVSNWQIDSKPSFPPKPENFTEEAGGVERPRLTWVADRDEWGHCLHRLFAKRPNGLVGINQEFCFIFTNETGHASRGQGRGRLSSAVLKSLFDDPSTGVSRQFWRAYLAVFFGGTSHIGVNTTSCCPPGVAFRSEQEVVGLNRVGT